MDLVLALLLLFAVAIAGAAALRRTTRAQPLVAAGRSRLRPVAAWISTRGRRRPFESRQAASPSRTGRLRTQGPLLGAAVALVLLPLAAVLLLGEQRRLPGFADLAPVGNPVVDALLAGEQLVPPPPLPPDVFETREVEDLRPDLGHADRDWSRLDATFAQTLLQLFRSMQSEGYPMVLIEGYRSPQRQDALQADSRRLTNAGAWQSAHQYGLAADCALMRDGRLVIADTDPWAAEGYRRFGIAAAAAGLTWGGRWQLRDYGHVEQREPRRATQLPLD